MDEGFEGFDYPELLRAATVGLVREVIDRAAEEGLPGEHHFFLTFRTRDPGVQLPARLALQYPDTMTIVLQHQYEDLSVEEEAFEVSLRFGGAWERLRVPFDALTSFLDPSVPFGLDFTQFQSLVAAPAGEAAPPAAGGAGERDDDLSLEVDPGDGEDPPSEPPTGGDVLPFRRR